MTSGKYIFIQPIVTTAFVLMLLFSGTSNAVAYSELQSADRAVEIAKRSRDRVERHGKALKASSHDLFKEFADRTVALQQLIDARERLETSGFLKKGDPEGDARRAHINGKILLEVGALKTTCDHHLADLLSVLEKFDETVAGSLVDSQATRSINSNYELTMNQYLTQEKTRFDQAALDARKSLEAYQDAGDERQKKRLLEKYKRAKKRLLMIEQRRKLFEARVQTAAMNQKITGILREKIREEGNTISSKFRSVMSDLYTTFAKVTPVAELGGTGSPAILSAPNFQNMKELGETLAIVDSSVEKLGGVLDDMVNDVLVGLGDVRIVGDNETARGVLSVEEEMEFLRKQRQDWEG